MTSYEANLITDFFNLNFRSLNQLRVERKMHGNQYHIFSHLLHRLSFYYYFFASLVFRCCLRIFLLTEYKRKFTADSLLLLSALICRVVISIRLSVVFHRGGFVFKWQQSLFWSVRNVDWRLEAFIAVSKCRLASRSIHWKNLEAFISNSKRPFVLTQASTSSCRWMLRDSVWL